MARVNYANSQPNTCISEEFLAATLKHVAEDNTIELSEATAKLIIEAITPYLTPSKITYRAFLFTAGLMILALIVVERLISGTMREYRRMNAEKPEFWQLCKDELERDREERRLERTTAISQKNMHQFPRHRLADRESFEYISGQPEEF